MRIKTIIMIIIFGILLFICSCGGKSGSSGSSGGMIIKNETSSYIGVYYSIDYGNTQQYLVNVNSGTSTKINKIASDVMMLYAKGPLGVLIAQNTYQEGITWIVN